MVGLGHRKLSGPEAFLLVLGSMVGSGILILPGFMVAALPQPAVLLGILLVGAALTVAGCLLFAELAAMFPRSGGQVHYLREGLGRMPSYLYGWAMFWLILSGLAATLAAAFAGFVDSVIPLPGHPTPLVVAGVATGLVLPAWGQAAVAIVTLAFLGAINARGLRFGGGISNVATLGKAVGFVAFGLLLLAGAHPSGIFASARTTATPALGEGIAAALAFSLFSFDGWTQATFVASEVRDPRRTIPKVLIAAPLAVAAIYMLVMAGYFSVLPTKLAAAIGADGSRLIGVEAARAAGGGLGAALLSAVALVSVFGTLNAFVLGAPRVFAAMAEQGILWKRMANVNRGGVPATAILYTVLWASLLVVTGVYDRLVYMVTFTIWLFYLLTAIAFLRLRKSRPEADRPFRVRGGRPVALVFILAATFVVVSLIGNPRSRAYVVLALAVVGTGFAGWFLQRGSRAPA